MIQFRNSELVQKESHPEDFFNCMNETIKSLTLNPKGEEVDVFFNHVTEKEESQTMISVEIQMTIIAKNERQTYLATFRNYRAKSFNCQNYGVRIEKL